MDSNHDSTEVQAESLLSTGPMTHLKFARKNPDRAIYCSNRTGHWQVWAWDRATDTHRQLTDHPHGVSYAEISPDGRRVVWFDDPNGGERGIWREQPYESEPGNAVPIAPGLPPAYPEGIEVGDGVTIVGLSNNDDGFGVYRVGNGEATELYRHRHHRAIVTGLSADETLVTIQHSEHGNPMQPSIRAVRVDSGVTVADLDDVGLELAPIAFSPIPGDRRVLVQHERGGRRQLLLWDPTSGDERELSLTEPGEVPNRRAYARYDQLARWSPDGRRAVFALDQGVNTQLYEYDLTVDDPEQALVKLDIPVGALEALQIGPDGVVYRWGSVTDPWQYRSVGDPDPLFPVLDSTVPPDTRCYELTVAGPDGPIPVTIVEPGIPAPPGGRPTVIGLHGGPNVHEKNAPLQWLHCDMLERGCLLVLPNFRGSDGHGSAWRHAVNGDFDGGVEDVAAVIKHVVGSGMADPDRVAVAGVSYGGYLGLMLAARHPELAVAGILASTPICDFEAMNDDPHQVPENRAAWPTRIGGILNENRDKWRQVSPVNHIGNMAHDIMVTYQKNDTRGLPKQVAEFLLRAHRLGKRNIRGRQFAGGHAVRSQTVAESAKIRAAERAFLCRKLGIAPDGPLRSVDSDRAARTIGPGHHDNRSCPPGRCNLRGGFHPPGRFHPPGSRGRNQAA